MLDIPVDNWTYFISILSCLGPCQVLFWLVHGLVDVMDFSPIREALRFNVYDHVGLLECPTITEQELLSLLEPFKDRFAIVLAIEPRIDRS